MVAPHRSAEAQHLSKSVSKAKLLVKVDAAARQIFARSARFYSPLDSLRIEWNDKVYVPVYGNSTRTFKMAWERRGRLRLEDLEGVEQIVVIDGKNRFGLDNSGLPYGEKAKFRIENIDGNDPQNLVSTELATSNSPAAIIEAWLEGTNPLEAEEVKIRVDAEELFALRAQVLPARRFKRTLCDLVCITTRYDDYGTTVPGQTIKQETFWLARKTGRLVRVQTRLKEGTQKPETGDLQVSKQEPNAKFDKQTFVLKKPKNAIVQKS